MKKALLFIAMFILTVSLNAQDTISGFSFPLNDTISKFPNFGLLTNKTYNIRKEDSATTVIDSITFTNGVTTGDYAATTINWDNGANRKFWSVKFKAPNYTSFKVSSKQRSGGNSPGPKNFQLQWKLSGGTYVDVPNGAIICANDWTTGVLNQLPVPITGQGTTSIYLRWLMTSNLDANGGTVAATGISKIDDIIITATSTTGVEETIFANTIAIYPNPSNGVINVDAVDFVNEINVYNTLGSLVYHSKPSTLKNSIDLSSFGKGIYFMNVRYDDNSYYTGKVVVR
ncbi:MAG: T9SS type A sorting domain-containing protein [Bacteroidetes bacterium]|nr:T9SS type A sorting domain-containing protein [Bacteroidota bacterium]